MKHIDKFTVQIPFGGFYHSVHSSQIDHEIEMQIDNFAQESGYDVPERLAEKLWIDADYPNAFEEYAKAYVEAFLDEYGLTGEFDGMESPREYNFTTDRVFAKIDRASLAKLWKHTDPFHLTRIAKERHTSRDGFISHYRPNWREWGSLSDWDHNQFMTLILAFLKTETGDEWDQWKEFELVEDLSGNGYISQWLEESPEYVRTLNILDYLRERAERPRFTMADFIAKLRAENRPFDQTPLGAYANL